MKVCISCGESKPLADFHKNAKYADGLNRMCKPCRNAYMREYYARNPRRHIDRVERSRTTDKRRAWKYGLSEEDVRVLFEKHGSKCHLCRKREAVAVDHDHETGAVRGALCQPCNVGLGMLGDSLEGLDRAREYLLASTVSIHSLEATAG